MDIDIQILDTPLETSACTNFVETAAAGGHVVFIGTVRDHTKGKRVIRLDFESYTPMALKEMKKICDGIHEKWPEILKISMHHRVGSLNIGEIPVIIAVSAAHRVKAFEACQFAIDTLKETCLLYTSPSPRDS